MHTHLFPFEHTFIDMLVVVSPDVRSAFPDIRLCSALIRGLHIDECNPSLDLEVKRIEEDFRRRLPLGALKDYGNVRAYRDFYWRIGIDPTKQRPAAEALIRRVLQGKSIPRINVAVDSINLASMMFVVSIAAYDYDKIVGKVVLRWSRDGELFMGIGDLEAKPIPRQLVLADDEKIIGLYPHRDSELSKITLSTKNVLLISCGVPGVSLDSLRDAIIFAWKLLEDYCGGKCVSFECI